VTWDFGDGSPPASGAEVTHVFGEPGSYTVTVTAEDDDSGLGQDTLVVVVKKVFSLRLPVMLR
jgi:PKD repeat protein